MDTALARIAAAARIWDLPLAALLRQGSHGPLWKGVRLEGAHREGARDAVQDLEERAAPLGRGRWAWDVAGALGAGWSARARLERLESRAQAILCEDGARVDAVSLLRDARAQA